MSSQNLFLNFLCNTRHRFTIGENTEKEPDSSKKEGRSSKYGDQPIPHPKE
jgi:hypothetical protein